MSLVVLGSDCESTWIVVRELQRSHSVSAVILESPESRKKFLQRRIKRLGLFQVVGQVLFQLTTPLLRRESASARRDIVAANNWNMTRPEKVKTHQVPSANHPHARQLLQDLAPSVIVINGTRILGRKLLESTDAPFLNMHAGITPKYRGVHGGYWALARRKPSQAGVTIHLVDAGIDTGDVLYQATIEVDKADNFATYPLLQLEAGLPLLVQAVDDALKGDLHPRRADGESELFYHPTLWGYLWTRWWNRVR